MLESLVLFCFLSCDVFPVHYLLVLIFTLVVIFRMFSHFFFFGWFLIIAICLLLMQVCMWLIVLGFIQINASVGRFKLKHITLSVVVIYRKLKQRIKMKRRYLILLSFILLRKLWHWHLNLMQVKYATCYKQKWQNSGVQSIFTLLLENKIRERQDFWH